MASPDTKLLNITLRNEDVSVTEQLTEHNYAE